MLTVSIWNQITIEFFGRSVYGSYVIQDRTLTVNARRGAIRALSLPKTQIRA